MSDTYDVVIIGAGPSGAFCAYELMEKKPDLKVLIIEKGRRIEKRECPKRRTKYVLDVNRVLLQLGLQELGHFRMANCHFLRM